MSFRTGLSYRIKDVKEGEVSVFVTYESLTGYDTFIKPYPIRIWHRYHPNLTA